MILYYSMSSSKWETLLGGCSNPFKKIWKNVLTNWKGCRIIIHAPSKTDARYANVAHLVERHLAKVEVASSSLVVRSILGSSQCEEPFFLFFESLAQAMAFEKLRNIVFSRRHVRAKRRKTAHVPIENFMTKSIPLLRGVCYNNKRL